MRWNRWLRDILMVVLGAVITWIIGWACSYVAPQSPTAIEWPVPAPTVRTIEVKRTLYWAVRVRPATDAEKRKVKLLHRMASDAAVFAIYVRNDSPTTVHTITLLGKFERPILAHLIPSAFNPTDVTGAPIRNQLRHFAYEKDFAVAFHEVPAASGISMYLAVPGGELEACCFMDDEVVQAQPWPSEVQVPEDIFDGLVIVAPDNP